MSTSATDSDVVVSDSSAQTLDLLDMHLPAYDVVLTEHLVVEAEPGIVFAAAKNFDFLTTRAPLVTALMTLRSVPSRLSGHSVDTPPTLRHFLEGRYRMA
jgi:hypothetical protein